MSTRMVQRKGTYQQWFDTNPTLTSGEIGYESDTNKFKIGNGLTSWNNLPYFIDDSHLTIMIENFATEEYVDTAINNAEVDLPSHAGTGLEWNATTSQYDVDSTIATKSYVDTAETDAITAAGTAADTKISTAVAALTKSSVGLGNVDNTADTSKPVSTAQATAIATAKSEAITDATSQVNALIAGAPGALNTLDELAAALNDDASFATTVTNSLALKSTINSPTFTGTVVLPSTTSIGNVSSTELGYVDGVTSGIQNQINTKSDIILAVNTTAKTSAYTLVSGDANTILQMNGAFAFTVPLNSSVPYPIGTQIHLLSITTGASVTFASGITSYATPGNKLRASGSMATLIKLNTDTWVLAGDLTA